MKSIRNLLTATLLAAGAVLTAATGMSIASAAEEAAAPQPPPPGPHGWHHGPWHLLGKLDLSAAQKQQIKDIMTAAHPQMQSLHEQMQANSLKLQQTKPTDPNYASIAAAGEPDARLAERADDDAARRDPRSGVQGADAGAADAAGGARGGEAGQARQAVTDDGPTCVTIGRIGVYRWVAPIPSFFSSSITLPAPTRWPVPTITR